MGVRRPQRAVHQPGEDRHADLEDNQGQQRGVLTAQRQQGLDQPGGQRRVDVVGLAVVIAAAGEEGCVGIGAGMDRTRRGVELREIGKGRASQQRLYQRRPEVGGRERDTRQPEDEAAKPGVG